MFRKSYKRSWKIAKELLRLYAEREQALKNFFLCQIHLFNKIWKTFPTEETPGQMSAIADVKRDMESDKPMDRLVCGDVGFGKTEVAIRATFRCVQSGKQVALHFSRYYFGTTALRIILEANGTIWHSSCRTLTFSNASRTKKILQELQSGKIDIISWNPSAFATRRFISRFRILIIDEEQRFGVKQKKNLRTPKKCGYSHPYYPNSTHTESCAE